MDRQKRRRLKHILESRRDEVLEILNRLQEEARTMDDDSPQDSADRSISSLSKESLFQQSSQRRRSVRMIEAALERIREGTFGVCDDCGNDIQPRRLDALPWTQFCLGCQEKHEQEAEQKSVAAFI
ncbi:MAG: TraR/DksA family transcriptional regulator [Terriglobales bacterium]